MSNDIPVGVRVIEPIPAPVYLAGTPVELGKNSTHLLWRYVGEPSWRNLIALSELGGPGGGGPADTDALPEGASNLYFTAQRALDATAGVTDGLAATIAAYQLTQDGVNTGLQNQINLKAPLADPVFTGTPTAPNPGPGTNTQQLATTAFVQAALGGAVPSDVVIGPTSTTEDNVPLWDSVTRKLKDGLATSIGGNGTFDALKLVRFTSTGQVQSSVESGAALRGVSTNDEGVHGTSAGGTALYGNVTGADAIGLRLSHLGASGYFIRAWKGGANDAFRVDRDGGLTWPDGGPGPQTTVNGLPVFASGAKGVVPASGGGTDNYLRADGTWAAPPGAAHNHDDRYYTETEVDAAQFFADRMFNARSHYRRNYFEFYTDYTGETTTGGSSADGEVESISGTGAGVGMVDGEQNRPGVAQLQTGSTATGRAILMSGVGAILLGGARWIMERAVQFSSVSTSAQRFAAVVGFIDTTALAQIDGVYFLYDEGGAHTGATASPNWQVVVSANSSRTIVDTGVAVAATTWSTLRIDINAAATEALMYIDGVLVHTFTSGIPTASGRHTGFGLGIHKSVGTTARGISTDYVHVQGAFTTPRA